MIFKPRTKAPEKKTDKIFFSDINPFNRPNKKGERPYVMPNCTCYDWSRHYEVWKEELPCIHNAETWYKEAKEAGWRVGQEPRLGSTVCFRCGSIETGKDGAGHVAFVEEIKPNGDIVCSNSGYGSTFFYMKTYKASKNYGYSSKGRKYELEGFIYPQKGTAYEKGHIMRVVKVDKMREQPSSTSKGILILHGNERVMYHGIYKVEGGIKWLHCNQDAIVGWIPSASLK